ncbi:MAG: hypothetical protein P8Q28_00390 [Luminiphilus sp.]|nr:hypothetical protein [Luminiphilus sp.]
MSLTAQWWSPVSSICFCGESLSHLGVNNSELSAEALADRTISCVYLSRNEYAKVAVGKILRQSALALGLGQSQSQSDVDKN